MSAHENRQIQTQSQLEDAVFDAVFVSVPEDDQKTYPDGWDQAKLNELHDAVQQMIAVIIDYLKARIAMGKALGDPFFAVEQTIEASLHPQVLAQFNTWARIKDPRAVKVTSIENISLEKWVEQFDFRAQMEAEVIGGDLANQLATLLLHTIHDLTMQSSRAMFADTGIKYRHQKQLVLKGITNDALMGTFRALLEQGLRKYEGKPGDSQKAMLGGILEYAKSLPNKAESVHCTLICGQAD